MSRKIRLTLDLTGILQGVGFRPTLARLVSARSLTGWVRNQAGCVRLVLYGTQEALDAFVAELPSGLPPQARLETLREISREPVGDDDADASFVILDSAASGPVRISIPADLVTCEHCLREIFDPDSRYYGYPFTTCTDCGPRYTVVESMPYDRGNTAMKAFPMCPSCRAEYGDMLDRRFHAETIACPACGPRLSLLDAEGRAAPGDPLREARRRLSQGQILAVRGLGGFLLCVDATDEEAVRRLRERKRRPHKPLAVMARDEAAVRRFCDVTPAGLRAMASSCGPIVICDLSPASAGTRPMRALSPDTDTLGVMLPATPLHHLLANPLKGDPVPPFELLVMTSGNRGGEPICLTNDEALRRLRGIADAFLTHDREILLRNDDSLAVETGGAIQVWRRARGYAPRSLPLPRALPRTVLAMGAHMKNAIALGFGNEAVLSPHVGDLDTAEAVDALALVAERLPRFFGKPPETVLVDLHPDMHSSRMGESIAERLGAPVVRVQHHHAHAAAVMAEHGLEEALGLVFDGTGLGTDGAIWGGELLHVSPGAFKRLGSFRGVPLPGGDAAIRHPARQLVARWIDAGLPPDDSWTERLHVGVEEIETWETQVRRRLNCPSTHAVGRLFDSFAAGLGLIAGEATYDGQAAVRLEAAARRAGWASYLEVPFAVRQTGGFLEVDFQEAFELLRAPPAAADAGRLANGFHRAVVGAAVRLAELGREMTSCAKVAVSGGVMMNRLVSENLTLALQERGFQIYAASLAPPGDGGIALGQIYAAGGMC